MNRPRRHPHPARRTLSATSGEIIPRRTSRPAIRAGGFDMTADNRHTAAHFADASNASIDVLISAGRAKMQERCRYEARNNGYLRSMIRSFAASVVGGAGPVLQVQTDSARANTEIETRFAEWAAAADVAGRTNLGGMLRQGLMDTVVMGEEITALTTHPADTADLTPRLRLKAVHPMRLDTPYLTMSSPNMYDGVEVDPLTGAPLRYHILSAHPGAAYVAHHTADPVPADRIIHLFFSDESEQHRGYPLIAPAIPLAAYLRRYTLATVAAAEGAANLAGVIRTGTTQPSAEEIDAMDEVQMPRGSLLTLPRGWDISQLKAEHPTVTYPAFKAELIAEIGRCVWMPYIVAAANAQGYNYSSGRLDLQAWWETLDIVRDYLAQAKLARILREWMREAALTPGYLRHWSAKMRTRHGNQIPHQWNWPSHKHVDPLKEATAAAARIAAGISNLAIECGHEGLDWEDVLDQRQREITKINLTPEETP